MPHEPNEVARRLREVRQAKGVALRELARRLNRSPAYVSKIEHGRFNPSSSYIHQVSSALDLRQIETHGLLALLTLYQTEHHPLLKTENALAERQLAIEHLEASAGILRIFQMAIVPGLLQTRDYAACIMASSGHPPLQIEQAVEKRMRRQRILSDKKKQFVFLMTESAARSRIGPNGVLKAQLEHLVKLDERANVALRFLPQNAKLAIAPTTSFVIHDDALVMIDTVSGFVSFRNPDDVRDYLSTFQRLLDNSIEGVTMHKELRRIASEIADRDDSAYGGRPN